MQNLSLKKISHQAPPNHMERFIATNLNWKIAQNTSFKVNTSSIISPKQNEPKKISGSTKNNLK